MKTKPPLYAQQVREATLICACCILVCIIIIILVILGKVSESQRKTEKPSNENTGVISKEEIEQRWKTPQAVSQPF